MTSKLSAHITTATQAEQMRDFLYHARVPFVKMVNPDRPLVEWTLANCPNTTIIGRKYWSNQPWDDPARVARGIMDMGTADLVRVWEGLNEPSRGHDAEGVKRAARLDRDVAQMLHAQGYQYVCGSWSVGVPDIYDWMLPEMLEALRETDYIGVHEYSAPRLDDPRGIEWFLLRHRLWYPQLPPECKKPLLITECGIDSGAVHWDPGAQGGWQSFTDAKGYMEQLAWYDAELQRDDYVKAATMFQWGSIDPRWDTYDHTEEFTWMLRDHIVSQQQSPEPPTDWEQLYYQAQMRVAVLETGMSDIQFITEEVME